MQPLESAILRTVLYADVFDFPLTLDELQRYLIHTKTTNVEELKAIIHHSQILQQALFYSESYICLDSRQELIALRKKREILSQDLWSGAIFYGRWLAHIPFVRMVALTGSLAAHNPNNKQEDFDYLLITEVGRVWLARAFAIILVRIVRIFGRELCPNYVLAVNQLEQTRQDLFIAHEIAQMKPLYGKELYHAMVESNPWVKDFLPNAKAIDLESNSTNLIKSVLEWFLHGRIGDTIENWEYRRKARKFRPQIKHLESAARIDTGQVKGHFNDHGIRILKRYQARLAEFGLVDDETNIITEKQT